MAIENANGNSLIGCTFQQDPFVFYNVISGNGGNGLRVTNSNNTTIQANFFGLGADNDTPVGNQLNGVVVEGSSANTVMGGPIPLGNVDAANGQNGIVVQDTASYFTTYNTFCGLAAFSDDPNLGNGQDGMLITSTGGNILIRTNVITENGDDGIEISGAASGVRVAGNIIGLNTNGTAGRWGTWATASRSAAMPTTSSSAARSRHSTSFRTTRSRPTATTAWRSTARRTTSGQLQLHRHRPRRNRRVRKFSGRRVRRSRNAVDHGRVDDPTLFSVISGNLGDGIQLVGTHDDTVVGSLIGTDVLGLAPLPNGGDGVSLINSFHNVIGHTASYAEGNSGGSANLIAFNGGNGVNVSSGSGNAIRGNSIYGNVLSGIDLGAGTNSSPAAPTLSEVNRLPLAIQLSGTLMGKASATYSIEFFVSDTNDSSGRYALGSMTVKTDASGTATFEFTGPLPRDGAHFVTATATDVLGNTSEFSLAAV